MRIIIFIYWISCHFIISFYTFSQQLREPVSYNDRDIVLQTCKALYVPVISDLICVQYEVMGAMNFSLGAKERALTEEPKGLGIAKNYKKMENGGGANKNQKDESLSWKKQLDFVIRGGYNGILDSSDLRLISYGLIDEEQSPTLEEFKEMPVQIISVNDQRKIPVILKISEKSKMSAYYGSRKRSMIDYYNRPDANLRLVKLEWIFKQTEFNTYCVVSETWDKLVYDDILSNAFIAETMTIDSVREHNSTLNRPLQKRR